MRLSRAGRIEGLSQVSGKDVNNLVCQSCILGKGKREPAPPKSIICSSPLMRATSFAAHSSQWILDSGASENMAGDRAWFESLHPMGSTVRIATAGGASLASHSLGSVHLANHKGERVVLGRVLFVPGLAFNLLSVSRLANIGGHIEFKGSLCKVTKENVEVLRADLEHKVWVVKGDQWEPGLRALVGMTQALPAVIGPTSNALHTQGISPSRTKATWDLWHRRLAHLGFDSMKMLFGGLSTGSSIARTGHSTSIRECACEGCVMGKIVRLPFPPSSSHAKNVLDLVHTDLCGPMGVDSIGGARYVMVLLDDHSRYPWVYFLRAKSDATKFFKDWLIKVERLTEHKLEIIRSDNGGEYTSNAFEKYLTDLGIDHQTTVPYTSQQNGVAERTNRTIVERTIALMHSERLPTGLWAEVMDTVVYLKNRSPSRALKRSTPFEALTGERPNLSHLRVVGCAAWSLIMKGKRDGKLAPRARLCCFLGYSNTQKAYKLWDPIERTVVISRDVTFDETISPSRLERPATPLSDLKSKLHFDRADKLPSPLNDSIPSTDADVFETVGDAPHAVEAVGAEDPVGAQEAERHETGEEIDRGQQDQPQYRGWEYVDPRYARSPAYTRA